MVCPEAHPIILSMGANSLDFDVVGSAGLTFKWDQWFKNHHRVTFRWMQGSLGWTVLNPTYISTPFPLYVYSAEVLHQGSKSDENMPNPGFNGLSVPHLWLTNALTNHAIMCRTDTALVLLPFGLYSACHVGLHQCTAPNLHCVAPNTLSPSCLDK